MNHQISSLTTWIAASFLVFMQLAHGQQPTSTQRTNKPPPSPSAPAHPERKPPSAPNADDSALEALEPFSRTVVERHSKYFVVTVDGTYWDRQVWLKRQELRDRMRKSVSAAKPPSDVERAHGASSTAPMNPDDESDGVRRDDDTGAYRYKDDLINPPLWRAKDGRTAITAEELLEARQYAGGEEVNTDDAKRPGKDKAPVKIRPKPYPFREVMPSELAWAIKEGRAELSKFSWRKRVVQPAFKPKQGEHKPPRPESAEFSWFREAIAVHWKPAGDQSKPKDVAPVADEPTKPKVVPDK